MLSRVLMSPPGSNPRSGRVGFFFLLLTLLTAGAEVWGIRASLAFLLR
jgi:hypothetical protein